MQWSLDCHQSFDIIWTILKVGIIIPIIFFSGCSESDDRTVDSIMPFNEGNEWNYQLFTTAGEGPVTVKVNGTGELHGHSVTQLVYNGYYYNQDYWVLLANLSQGLFFFGDSFAGICENSELWCPIQASPGQTWTTSENGELTVWEVLGTAEKVTVPAGTFSCILVRRTTGGVIIRTWWAVGIGFVKMINDYASFTFVLNSYSLNP